MFIFDALPSWILACLQITCQTDRIIDVIAEENNDRAAIRFIAAEFLSIPELDKKTRDELIKICADYQSIKNGNANQVQPDKKNNLNTAKPNIKITRSLNGWTVVASSVPAVPGGYTVYYVSHDKKVYKTFLGR